MESTYVKLPEPIVEIIDEISDLHGKSKADVIREYVEEGLEEDGYLDHLNEKTRERLREEWESQRADPEKVEG